ncbi:sulfate transporter CysZ [Sulfuriflexus sp.]|uniref:sulfate transporter CysZ n=1 Tax=Sulfuriflexus sp. TaxID=2015443 RepID=UPI0028CEEB1C|nr:sulfate transporter CysZ [Sulfuriflexus sp.]MDT8403022.1 sulfate transporter CysZ [Sulfuriflexus sp.]
MIANAIQGIGYFIRGIGLLGKPGIRLYVVIPATINILLFAALIIFGYSQFMELVNYLAPSESSWFSWLRWILIPIFFVTSLIIVFFTFTLFANLIGAPFNSLLAAAVEKHLTGSLPQSNSNWKAVLKSLIPIMFAELKKMAYYILITIPFLILFIIPVVNILAPFLWMLMIAWVMAVEYTDYPMGNHEVSFAELRRRLKQRRLMAFGFGGSVMLAMSIPVVNFFVMPTAVAGATAMAVEKLKSE